MKFAKVLANATLLQNFYAKKSIMTQNLKQRRLKTLVLMAKLFSRTKLAQIYRLITLFIGQKSGKKRVNSR